MLLLLEVPDELYWEVKELIDREYPICPDCGHRVKRSEHGHTSREGRVER